MSIAGNLAAVREAIARAAAGREVTLIAVSKMHTAEKIAEAYAAGQRDFGENYAQELLGKAEALRAACPDLRWHFIGRLQKNKINALVPHVFAWHTVDSAETARALHKRAAGARVFVQVNIGREAQKGGVMPEDLPAMLRAMPFSPLGFMAIPPAKGDPSDYFRALARLRDTHLPTGQLSMGMSHDFAEAIVCGATQVRIGTAIFGERS